MGSTVLICRWSQKAVFEGIYFKWWLIEILLEIIYLMMINSFVAWNMDAEEDPILWYSALKTATL